MLKYFFTKEKSFFIKRKSQGYLIFPTKGTYKIISVAEKIFNIYLLNKELSKKYISTILRVQVFRNIDFENIFPELEEH